MTLHYTPRTISAAVAIVLNETGLDHTLVKVDFATAEQTKPDFLKINPKARVPALITEHGVLTETPALLDYLAALAPAANLIPTDLFQAAHMRSVMAYLASTMHINHAHGMRGTRWASLPASHEDMANNVVRTMTQSTHYIESHALKGDYVCGPDFTLADPYLFTICTWLKSDGVDIAKFPKLQAFQKRIASRASVQKAYADGVLVQ
ncbi:MAG: glutathione S-transferase family protein [Sedimentitalea sp.]